MTSIVRVEVSLLVLCLLAISACEDDTGIEADGQRGGVTTTRAGPDRFASTPTVGCSAAITSRVDPRWRSRSIVRGPLGIYGEVDIRRAARWGPSAFWTKVPVILAGRRPVTLRVASRDRHRVGLTYGPAATSPASSEDGARGLAAAPRTVRFVACPHRTVTAWPGGLALADRRPRVGFEVRVEGRGWRALSIPARG